MTKQELKDIIKECFFEEGIVTEDVIYEGYEDDMAMLEIEEAVFEATADMLMEGHEIDMSDPANAKKYGALEKAMNKAHDKFDKEQEKQRAKEEAEAAAKKALLDKAKAYKEEHGCGMQEAKLAVCKKKAGQIKQEVVEQQVEVASERADKLGLSDTQKKVLIGIAIAAAGVAVTAVIIKVKKEAAAGK